MAPNKIALLLATALSLGLAASAQATPRAGTRELRIGQEYQVTLRLPDGFLRFEEDGNGLTLFGAGAGYGAFLSDHFELGLSLSAGLAKATGSDNSASVIGASPFLRLMSVSGSTAYFGELVVGVQRFSSGGSGSNSGATVFEVGLDLGLEFFVTDDWAVRLAPGYRRYFDSDGDGLNRFGITWGLACYF